MVLGTLKKDAKDIVREGGPNEREKAGKKLVSAVRPTIRSIGLLLFNQLY